MPTREELIQAVKRKRLMKAVENKREQDGMDAATKMADRGGDQEGVEATPMDVAKAYGTNLETGLTFGASDKLRALGESISPLQMLPGFESTTYDEALSRGRTEQAEIDSKAPIAALAGDVSGTMLQPLGAIKKVGQAVVGGIEGAGRTEDLFSAQGAKDVATGAGLGLALGAGGELVGKGLEKAGRAINKGVNKAADAAPDAINLATGMHPSVTKGIYKDPAAFKGAKDIDKIGTEFQGKLDALRTRVRELDDTASKHLSDAEVGFDGFDKEVLSILEKGRVINKGAKEGQFSVSNLADSTGTYGTVEKVLNELETVKPTEKNVKRIIRQLDDMSAWESATPDTTKKVLRQVRRSLDQRLKSGNTEYRDAMAETAKKTDVLKRMEKHFNIKKGDMTKTSHGKLDALKKVTAGSQRKVDPVTKELMDDFGGGTLKDLEYSRLGDIAEQSSAQGSRRTVAFGAAGSAMGGAIGGFPGAAIGGQLGAGLGYLVDSKGKKWASDMITAVAKDKTKWNTFLKEVGFSGSEKLANKLRESAAVGGLKRMIIVNHIENKRGE